MTTKEVAQALGLEESYIETLCEEGFIDTFLVERSVYNKYGRCIRKEYKFEIPPEEVDYIDWWINIGKEQALEEFGGKLMARELERPMGTPNKRLIKIYKSARL